MSRKPPRPNRSTPPSSRERQTADRARQLELAARAARARRRRSIVGLAATAIVVVLAALIFLSGALSGGQSSAGSANATPAPAVLDALTSVPPDRFAAVGRGGVSTLPTPIRAQMLRGTSNLPRIVYVGAEYCPYCAAERWPLIVALSRFGSFTGLKLVRSAADDVYPNTPTFTFYGSTYTSQYLAFEAVETATSERQGNSYKPLQDLTTEQRQLLDRYDAPPYVPQQSAGAIPFLDVANQYVLVGGTYDAGLLQGKSWEQISQSLGDPNSTLAKGILGSANIISAAICQATGDNPASVCGAPEIKAIEADLAKAPVPK